MVAPSVDENVAARSSKHEPDDLSRAIESAPLGVMLTNADGAVEYCNARARDHLGLADCKQMAGCRPGHVTRAVDEDRGMLAPSELPWEVARRTGEDQLGVRIGVRRQDGELDWLEIDAVICQRGPNGAADTILSTIVERSHQNDRHTAGNRNLQDALDRMSDAYYELDDALNFMYINAQAGRLLRIPPERLIGRNVWDVFPEAKSTALLPGMEQVLAGEDPVTIDLFYPPFASWFEARIFPIASGLSVYFRDVTEPHRVAAALRESEAQFRAVIEQLPAVIYTERESAPRRLTYLSPYVETLLGYPPERFLDEPGFWTRCIHPDDTARIHAVTDRAMETGERFTIEYRMRAADGRLVWVEDTAELISDAAGKHLWWQGVALDITARKEAQDRIAESEERLRLALEAAGIGAWDYHVPTDTVIWSPTLCALLGLPEETRTTKSETFRATVVHPEDRARTTAEGASFRAGGSSVRMEYRIVRPNGDVRWLVDIGKIVDRAPNGSAIRSSGVTIDVTDLRRSQEAIRLRDRAHSAVQDGIIIVDMIDPRQPVIDANPAFFQITGYSHEDMLGRNCRVLQGPETDPSAVAAIRAALRDGRDVTVTLLNYRRDGAPFWNELHLAPVWSEFGAITHFVGVVRDVTARIAAERELRFQSELLDQATVAVIATDVEGSVTHWNRHAELLYGWRRDEILGRNIGDLTVGPTETAISEAIMARIVAGQTWEGDFTCRRKDGVEIPVHVVDSPIRDDSGKTIGVVGVSVDVSERKMLEGRLTYQATHDHLTALPNRTLFTERLARAIADAERRGRALTVLFLDLDGFKRINDSFGHAMGDELLVAVGRRLEAGMAHGATLARFGGDEFTILLPNASTPGDAKRSAEAILERLREPFELDGREIYVDTSIGVAQSSSELAKPEDLLRAADVALYQAKSAGRAMVRMSTPGAAFGTSASLQLEAELRRAVEREELRLFFQPEVDLQTGSIVGAEALVRWQHPRLGLLAPGEFIEIAEESNLIVPIGDWVLNEACRQRRLWQTQATQELGLSISVNLTARQLRQPDLIAQIERSLRQAQLTPSQLKLEITERTVVEDAEWETNVLSRLRQLGVKLAIDDFGTGYSSLGYLRRWPVDTIKIDRSFVAGVEAEPEAQSLVLAMAGLAHALGADVTAEGIETAGQLAWLRGVNIERGQGYLFSRPIEAEAFQRMLLDAPTFDIDRLLGRQRV